MGVSLFALIGLAYMASLILACAYVSRALYRRTQSPVLGTSFFVVLMTAMWCDTAYQRFVLQPKLCDPPHTGTIFFGPAKLPAEYFQPDGRTSQLFSQRLKLGKSRRERPDVMVDDRYALLREYETTGDNSFNRVSRERIGVWDYKLADWTAVATTSKAIGGLWWARPLAYLPDAGWTISRLSNSLVGGCPGGEAYFDVHTVFKPELPQIKK